MILIRASKLTITRGLVHWTDRRMHSTSLPDHFTVATTFLSLLVSSSVKLNCLKYLHLRASWVLHGWCHRDNIRQVHSLNSQEWIPLHNPLDEAWLVVSYFSEQICWATHLLLCHFTSGQMMSNEQVSRHVANLSFKTLALDCDAFAAGRPWESTKHAQVPVFVLAFF